MGSEMCIRDRASVTEDPVPVVVVGGQSVNKPSVVFRARYKASESSPLSASALRRGLQFYTFPLTPPNRPESKQPRTIRTDRASEISLRSTAILPYRTASGRLATLNYWEIFLRTTYATTSNDKVKDKDNDQAYKDQNKDKD